MELLRLKKVVERTGLTRSTVYRFMASSDFPQSVKLGPGMVAWVSGEVDQWIRQCIEASRSLVSEDKSA